MWIGLAKYVSFLGLGVFLSLKTTVAVLPLGYASAVIF